MSRREKCPNCHDESGLNCNYASLDYEEGVETKYLSDLMSCTYICSECGAIVSVTVRRKNYRDEE